MIRYAQEDTHYLLYIYHCMRNELIDRGNAQRNLLQSVFQRSRDVCLKVSSSFVDDGGGHVVAVVCSFGGVGGVVPVVVVLVVFCLRCTKCHIR